MSHSEIAGDNPVRDIYLEMPWFPIKALSRDCRVALPSLNPDWLKISSGGDLQLFSLPPQNHAIYTLLVST